jgi:hypothetical protein
MKAVSNVKRLQNFSRLHPFIQLSLSHNKVIPKEESKLKL